VSDGRIPLFDVQLSEAALAAVDETLRSGWLTMGPRTQDFEAAFAQHLEAEHAIALSSCTAALHLAYLAAGVGAGDEVIVPALTFVASAAAARYCNAVPVLADVIGDGDLGIDPEHAASLIGPKTKAICAVHYAGYAAPTAALRELCDKHGLALVEDAAHSPLARDADGGALGTIGQSGCFSFFSNKVLSCGEGGALATNDDEVAATVRSLRSHAMTSGTWDRHKGHAASYDVVGLGYNYRLDEPRAALLTARLAELADDVGARRRLVHRYREQLAGIEGITVPYRDDEVDRSSCYVMPTLLDDAELRDPLRTWLSQEAGVQTSVLYPAIHEFTAYEELSRGPLPRAERIARAELTLPLFPHLSEEDQDRVIAGVGEGLAAVRGG
jgi:dTDP-4-amino-4,6-dideoxygalactose transaminase